MNMLYEYVIAPVLSIVSTLGSFGGGLAEDIVPNVIAEPIAEIGDAFVSTFNGFSETVTELLIMFFRF